MKINKDDKQVMKAYIVWYFKKYESYPTEWDLSSLINNKNCEHRDLVENFLNDIIHN